MSIGNKNNAGNNRLFYPALIICALFLLIPAFYNHYPLVNPDTATYLASGFKPETPFDRPITYGLLIRLFSLNGLSLWLVVFAQAYLVSWLLFKIIRNIGGNRSYIFRAMAIVLFLSVFSGLSWVVSQVQPDVFTTIALLCVFLLLINKEGSATEILLYVLFFLSVAVHLSHPLLFSVLLALLFISKKVIFRKERYRQVSKKILILFLLAISAIAIMGAAISKSKHVFFVGSLLEKGVLKKYLDDNCPVKNYKICAYKDSLPASANDFWWDNNSPLYKIGDWKGTKPEFNDIIHNTLTTPQYLGLYITATTRQAWKQACTFNIGDGNTSFPSGSNVSQRVTEYFPGEIKQFNASKQNSIPFTERNLSFPNTVFSIVFYACIAAILFVFIRWKYTADNMRLLLFLTVSGIVLNCLDCAAFTVVNGRYGCKMIWLLPFCIMLYFTTGRTRSDPRSSEP